MLLSGGLFALIASDSELAAWGFIRWVLAANLLLGLIAILRTERGTIRAGGMAGDRIFWLAILSGALICAVFGIRQRAGAIVFVGAPYKPPNIDSTFGFYSNYTAYLAFASVVGILLLVDKKLGVRTRTYVLVSTCVVVSQLAQGMSRGSILFVAIALLVALAVLAVKSPGRSLSLLAISSIGVLAVYLFTPPRVLEEFTLRFIQDQGGDVYRSSLQRAGWNLLVENPFGLGFGGFVEALRSDSSRAYVALAHPHRLWTELGLELGWIGLVAICVLIGIALGRSLRTSLKQLNMSDLIAGACLAGFAVQGWVDYFFFETSNLVGFVFILAASLVGPLKRVAPRSRTRDTRSNTLRQGVFS
ncbi:MULTISPECIES: O-antigen ligase family protein [Nocardiaceae]|uniref:O-antigen ligase-related domain-containing protein n=1 Tax=Rhodococcoides kroppenstedtii TaxID=293050 RepID=A0ABS7NW41_9NOCA|nr:MULTISPECIES: O-antigen ligase family protein [Rhodococcus]MBY6322224.1 hypothetical protein [Rhodococcus kroppenstedtii]MBY6401027.1 hypothetical protein [Rhodococcus kroppenstedtii]